MICPICKKDNDDNWPLEVDSEIKDGGCQDCWEWQCDTNWWEALITMDKFLETEAVIMSLDVFLTEVMPATVFSSNITHNLGVMAEEAGIYMHLWRPEAIGITKANQLVEPLRAGLDLLLSDPERFKKFDAPNGWGKYEHLVEFVSDYLKACTENGGATVGVCR